MARLFLAVSLWSLFSAPALARTSAKYFVVVRGVDEAPGVESGFVDEAKQLFIAELKRHPEFLLEPPPGLPSEPAKMAKALKQKHLRAFEVTLKILDVHGELQPPKPGKIYKTLVRSIKLSVFGVTLPERILAIGGDGDAEVATEVGKSEDIDKEAKQLLAECTKVAVGQAVDMTLTKLNLAGKPARLKSKKKKA
jgi:hypothetical protein